MTLDDGDSLTVSLNPTEGDAVMGVFLQDSEGTIVAGADNSVADALLEAPFLSGGT